MKDSWFDVPVQGKAIRVCANALCRKTLSKLNKQDHCFCCHNRRLAETRCGVFERRIDRIFPR